MGRGHHQPPNCCSKAAIDHRGKFCCEVEDAHLYYSLPLQGLDLNIAESYTSCVGLQSEVSWSARLTRQAPIGMLLIRSHFEREGGHLLSVQEDCITLSLHSNFEYIPLPWWFYR